MTANELIDKLESVSIRLLGKETEQVGRAIILYRQAATMLREQQAELDAFKLNYYNTGYSLQLRDKDETIRQQQAEIEQLQDRLNEFLVARDLTILKKASEQ